MPDIVPITLVEDDEFVYRRFPSGQDYYNPELELPVSPLAFRPTDADVNGLSVTRVIYTTSPLDALIGVKDEKKPFYYVTIIPVIVLKGMGFNVVHDPNERAPGHSLIPALHSGQYKPHLTQLLELARIASENIVHKPTASK